MTGRGLSQLLGLGSEENEKRVMGKVFFSQCERLEHV